MKMEYKGKYYELRRIAKELVFENHALQAETLECRQQICKRERERELLFEHLLNYEQEKWELDREVSSASAEKNKNISKKQQETDRRKRLKAAESILSETMAHSNNSSPASALNHLQHTFTPGPHYSAHGASNSPASLNHHLPHQMQHSGYPAASANPSNAITSLSSDDHSGSSKIPKIKIVFQQKGGNPATAATATPTATQSHPNSENPTTVAPATSSSRNTPHHQSTSSTSSQQQHSYHPHHQQHHHQQQHHHITNTTTTTSNNSTEAKLAIKNKLKRTSKVTSKIEPIVISLPTSKDSTGTLPHNIIPKKPRSSSTMNQNLDHYMRSLRGGAGTNLPPTTTSLTSSHSLGSSSGDGGTHMEPASSAIHSPSLSSKYENHNPSLHSFLKAFHQKSNDSLVVPSSTISGVSSSISITQPKPDFKLTTEEKSKTSAIPIKKTDFTLHNLKNIKQRIDNMNSRSMESNLFRNVTKALPIPKSSEKSSKK